VSSLDRGKHPTVAMAAPAHLSPPHTVVQLVQDGTREYAWYLLIAVFVFSCLATRFITGLQSQPRRIVEGEPQPVRKLPYWIPGLGHAVSYIWSQRGFVGRARYDSNDLFDEDIKTDFDSPGKPSMSQWLHFKWGCKPTTWYSHQLWPRPYSPMRGRVRTVSPSRSWRTL
jgi:hypothetical protein